MKLLNTKINKYKLVFVVVTLVFFVILITLLKMYEEFNLNKNANMPRYDSKDQFNDKNDILNNNIDKFENNTVNGNNSNLLSENDYNDILGKYKIYFSKIIKNNTENPYILYEYDIKSDTYKEFYSGTFYASGYNDVNRDFYLLTKQSNGSDNLTIVGIDGKLKNSKNLKIKIDVSSRGIEFYGDLSDIIFIDQGTYLNRNLVAYDLQEDKIKYITPYFGEAPFSYIEKRLQIKPKTWDLVGKIEKPYIYYTHSLYKFDESYIRPMYGAGPMGTGIFKVDSSLTQTVNFSDPSFLVVPPNKDTDYILSFISNNRIYAIEVKYYILDKLPANKDIIDLQKNLSENEFIYFSNGLVEANSDKFLAKYEVELVSFDLEGKDKRKENVENFKSIDFKLKSYTYEKLVSNQNILNLNLQEQELKYDNLRTKGIKISQIDSIKDMLGFHIYSVYDQKSLSEYLKIFASNGDLSFFRDFVNLNKLNLDLSTNIYFVKQE